MNHRVYKKGEVYKAEHPNEKILFPMFVNGGNAEFYDPSRPEKEIKVTIPKSTKTRTKKK